MRILSLALLLMASVAFVLVGCSDNSTVPVSPTDQQDNAPGSLTKISTREFTGTMVPNYADLGFIPGFTKYPDGKLIVRGNQENIVFNVTFLDGGTDLLTGNGILELNGTADYAAAVGEFWGNLTLTPLAPEALGGVWKLTWHSKGTFNGSEWTIPLKELGHGNGGALTGMQCFFDHTITAAPDFQTWTGVANGYVKTH